MPVVLVYRSARVGANGRRIWCGFHRWVIPLSVLFNVHMILNMHSTHDTEHEQYTWYWTWTVHMILNMNSTHDTEHEQYTWYWTWTVHMILNMNSTLARESLVSAIRAGDGKTANHFLQCTIYHRTCTERGRIIIVFYRYKRTQSNFVLDQCCFDWILVTRNKINMRWFRRFVLASNWERICYSVASSPYIASPLAWIYSVILTKLLETFRHLDQNRNLL